eukprot:10855102-Lingulodinium_polyedra.AAC.1
MQTDAVESMLRRHARFELALSRTPCAPGVENASVRCRGMFGNGTTIRPHANPCRMLWSNRRSAAKRATR